MNPDQAAVVIARTLIRDAWNHGLAKGLPLDTGCGLTILLMRSSNRRARTDRRTQGRRSSPTLPARSASRD